MQYIPLDYIKCWVSEEVQDVVLNRLDFQSPFNHKTSEISQHLEAEVKGIKFKKFPSGLMTMGGSLHKFKNNGLHNHDSFTLAGFKEVIRELYQEIGIPPHYLQIIRMEIGFNLSLNTPIDNILNGCIEHKGQRFSSSHSNKMHYLRCAHDSYFLKVYNKGLQYGLDSSILRVEVHYKNWQKHKKNGEVTLWDFINSDKTPYMEDLLTKWNEIILCEKEIQDSEHYKYSLPSFWSELSTKSRTTKKRHRDGLKGLNQRHGKDVQSMVGEAIKKTFIQFQ